MLNWDSAQIATWYGTVDVDNDGNIVVTGNGQTAAGTITISVKGQNGLSTEEPEEFGSLGNAFVDIFSLPQFIFISRRSTQELPI